MTCLSLLDLIATLTLSVIYPEIPGSAYTIKTFKIPWISVSVFYKMIHYYIILVQPVKNKTVKQLLEILSVLHRLVKNKSVNEGCWKG